MNASEEAREDACPPPVLLAPPPVLQATCWLFGLSVLLTALGTPSLLWLGGWLPSKTGDELLVAATIVYGSEHALFWCGAWRVVRHDPSTPSACGHAGLISLHGIAFGGLVWSVSQSMQTGGVILPRTTVFVWMPAVVALRIPLVLYVLEPVVAVLRMLNMPEQAHRLARRSRLVVGACAVLLLSLLLTGGRETLGAAILIASLIVIHVVCLPISRTLLTAAIQLRRGVA